MNQTNLLYSTITIRYRLRIDSYESEIFVTPLGVLKAKTQLLGTKTGLNAKKKEFRTVLEFCGFYFRGGGLFFTAQHLETLDTPL